MSIIGIAKINLLRKKPSLSVYVHVSQINETGSRRCLGGIDA